MESSLLLLFDGGEGRGYKFSKQSASERPKYLILKTGSWLLEVREGGGKKVCFTESNQKTVFSNLITRPTK